MLCFRLAMTRDDPTTVARGVVMFALNGFGVERSDSNDFHDLFIIYIGLNNYGLCNIVMYIF